MADSQASYEHYVTGLFAQEDPPPDQTIGPEFTAADTNQDGYVTASEFDAVQGDEYSEEEDAE